MRTLRRLGLLLGLASLLVTPLSARQVSLALVPDSTTVGPGDLLTVDVVASGLGDFATPALRTFDLRVGFDDGRFALESTTFGLLLGDPSAAVPEAITGATPGLGEVRVLEVSMLPTPDLVALQPASFTLATVELRATGVVGSTILTLEAVSAPGDQLADPLAVEVVGVGLNPALAIPTSPAALLLLALALGGVAVLVIRRLG